MSDAPLEVCPQCNGRVRRVVGSVGVVFKGNGFYVTDNRNGNSTNKSSTATTKKPEKEASPTTESTPKSEKSNSKATEKSA